MGILVGFVVGYLLGTRDGRERLEELREAWRTIAASPEFQAFSVQALGVLSAATPILTRVALQQGSGLAQQLASLGLGGIAEQQLKDVLGEILRGRDGGVSAGAGRA